KGLTFAQRIQYLLSALYYIHGLVVLIDISMPLFYLYFGLEPVSASTTSFALFFIPYISLTLYTIYLASGKNITFRSMSFSTASFMIQLSALWSILRRQESKFVVTPKQQQEGNFLYLIYPHLTYIALSMIGFILNITKYSGPAIYTNTAWTIFNIIMFMPFINAAYNWKALFTFKPAENYRITTEK
ncbi:MAG: hypothetical protein ACM3IJ_05310, partial [Candidatus Levyibacteriota bacterium]